MSWFKITQIGNKVVGVEKLPPQKFQDDDWVVLMKDNPFKGSLRGKAKYQVLTAYPKHIALMADNGTIGTFSDQWFSPVNSVLDAHATEYEEAMQAQKILEGL